MEEANAPSATTSTSTVITDSNNKNETLQLCCFVTVVGAVNSLCSLEPLLLGPSPSQQVGRRLRWTSRRHLVSAFDLIQFEAVLLFATPNFKNSSRIFKQDFNEHHSLRSNDIETHSQD